MAYILMKIPFELRYSFISIEPNTSLRFIEGDDTKKLKASFTVIFQ